MESLRKIFIHKTAEVSPGAVIGNGTSVWQRCIIQDGSVLGCDCNVGANVFIEKGVRIGNNVKIKNNISIYSGVICEDDVFLGPACVFTNVVNPRSFISRKNEFRQTCIKKGATIGANATVVCGHTIGSYAMVGAGSVVTKDLSDYELVTGNPAKRIGYVCQCGCRLETEDNVHFRCTSCSKKYELNERMEEKT